MSLRGGLMVTPLDGAMGRGLGIVLVLLMGSEWGGDLVPSLALWKDGMMVAY